MDSSANSSQSSPTSYTSSTHAGKDDTVNSSVTSGVHNSSSNSTVTTPNTSMNANVGNSAGGSITAAAPSAGLGPIGSKSATGLPAGNPWAGQQTQQQTASRRAPGGAIGGERLSTTATSGTGNIFGGSDWISPLKSAPGFERSRAGQFQQLAQQEGQQHAGHPGMQARSVSTSGIASIGTGRRQVSEANSVRSSRPASPSVSILTSPSIIASPASLASMSSLSFPQGGLGSFTADAGAQSGNSAGNSVNNGTGSTSSDLESAFDAMLRGSSLFKELCTRVDRLDAQLQTLLPQDGNNLASLQTNGHYDATPTRSPSVAGSTTSSYLTAPSGPGMSNRPQSLLIPGNASTGNSQTPILPPHASTEPSTPVYGSAHANSTVERDAIRQLTVQLSALGNNVAQLMSQQQQGPQTPSVASSPYDMTHPPMHGGHPHAGPHMGHHHNALGRGGMQSMRGGNFDVPRGAAIPRGGPAAAFADDRDARKRPHMNLQAPTPMGMGSRRASADVIENMHAVAEGMPANGGGPGAAGLGGSQSLLGKWEALGVTGDMLRAIVKYGIGPPSKIQMKAIPCILNTQDIVAQASSIQERIQSYVIPTLQVVYNNLQQAHNEGPDQAYRGVQALVLTATIDQAGQAQRMCLGLGQALGITSSLVVGQGDVTQEAAVFSANPPHILVGTPQKLLDLLNLRSIPLDRLSLFVIDEMDQLIARNLADYVNNLAKLLPPPMSSPANSRERSPAPGGPGSSFKPFEQSGAANNVHERQTAIFSCTVPQEVLNFASALNLREPVRVLVRRENNQNESNAAAIPNLRGVKHWFLYLAVGGSSTPGRGPMGARQESHASREWKLDALADLCGDADFAQCVVYCSSIDSVEAVAYKLSSRNIEALALHGDMGAPARHAIVTKFRSGNMGQGRGMAVKRVLVVYDALCRTLSDIHQVAMVVNYDLPRAVEDYIHRVSCAASSGYGRAGSSVNIVSSSTDIDMLRSIESFYRLKINELPPSLSNII